MKNTRQLFAVFLVSFVLLIPMVLAGEVPRDFYVEVSKGNVPGHSIARLSGINPAVGNTYEDVISVGGLYVWPTTASLLNVSSTDADDTNGGNGAWNVTIEGLAANWTRISETILLNGLTNVSSTLEYIRVNEFCIRKVGSSGTNEGTIVATSQLNLLTDIIPIHGCSQYAIYSVPVNMTAIPYSALVTSSEDKTVEVELELRRFGEGWTTRVELFTYRSNSIFDIKAFQLIPGKSDIKIKSKVGATTGAVGATLNMILIENSILHNSTLNWSDGSVGEVITSSPSNNALLYLFIIVVIFGLLAFGRRR